MATIKVTDTVELTVRDNIPEDFKQYYTFKSPEYSYWMELGNHLRIPILKGKEPCWLHRKMQGLVLGIKYVEYK